MPNPTGRARWDLLGLGLGEFQNPGDVDVFLQEEVFPVGDGHLLANEALE